MNCLTKQKLCFKHKVVKTYVGKCTGKQLTFNDLLKESKDNKPAESNTATTNIKPPAETNDDSNASELNSALNEMDIYQTAELEEFGQGNYPVTMSTTQGRIFPETVPSYTSLQKTANVPDKNCLIFLKNGMTLEKMTCHLFSYHDNVYLVDEFDLDEWYEAEERWNGEPTPANTDSENEVSTVEEVIEDSFAQKLPILLPRPKESGNSSDSSSYNSSSSQKKKMKKSQAKRITDRSGPGLAFRKGGGRTFF